jgi:hypothetical protein
LSERPKKPTLAVVLALAGVACAQGACVQGRISGSGPAPSTGAAGTSVPPGPGLPVVPPGNDPDHLLGNTAPKPAVFAPAASTLRRLTVAQYRNSVRDLLGAAVTPPSDLEPDTALDGFASIGAARVSLSSTAVEQFETAALALSHQALADAKTRASLVTCTPAGAADDACARQFVTSFGRRAWRRDLTTDEVTRYAGIATNASGVLKDFWAGLEYALAGLLQSPHFLYREELGTTDPAEATRRVFTGYELASRLSFFIWNSTPDDKLLDAAKAGKLATVEGLGAEAQRLFDSPRSHDATGSFFTELLRLGELDDLPQLPAAYPQVSATLGASMRGETLRGLDDLVFAGDNDFRQLFDANTTYVNAELAKLYGLPAPAGTDFVKTALPDGSPRAGLLGQASFLALNAHADSSSPTRRGKFIREVLLCQSIPPPPPNVDTTFPVDVPGAAPTTTRQKLEKHRTLGASCTTCHKAMDPIGLGLENFDGIGAYRTKEAGQTIDASGDLDGATFTDARGLGAALKSNPDVGSCLARGVLRYATGHIEVDGEESVVNAVSQQFATDGYRFRSLLFSVVISAGFRYAGVPQ